MKVSAEHTDIAIKTAWFIFRMIQVKTEFFVWQRKSKSKEFDFILQPNNSHSFIQFVTNFVQFLGPIRTQYFIILF